MKCVAATLFSLQLLASPAQSAFEAMQALSSPGAFDPIRPGLHYWHGLPQRLVDGDPRLYMAAAQPYGLTALRTAAAEITAHPGPLGLGFSCTAMGQSTVYGELVLSAALAVEVWESLAMGIGGHYGHVHFGGQFSSLHEFTASAGLRATLTRMLSLDVSISNLHPKGNGDRRLWTTGFSAGVTWQHGRDLALKAGVHSGNEWNLGETIRLGRGMALAAGLCTAPLRLQAGVLMSVGKLGFDFLYRDHPELGGDVTVGILLRL